MGMAASHLSTPMAAFMAVRNHPINTFSVCQDTRELEAKGFMGLVVIAASQ